MHLAHETNAAEIAPLTQQLRPEAALGVDACAALMRLKNQVARLRKQFRMHAVNVSLLIVALSLFLLWPGQFTRLARPNWLRGFELHLSVLLVLMLLGQLYLRFRRGIAELSADWLASQPIALSQRVSWLRAKIAARSVVALGVYSALAAWLMGSVYGSGVLLFGAGLGVVTLILLARRPIVQQEKIALPAAPSRLGKGIPAHDVIKVNASSAAVPDVPAEAHAAAPFYAMFASAIPRLSNLSWWWLLPLLLLPMGSNFVVIAAIIFGFLILTRFLSVCTALVFALAQISKLTQTMPLRPVLLYQAALYFSTQGALLVALIAVAVGLAAGSFGVAVVVVFAGLLLLATALHFGFGYRSEPLVCATRTRAGLLIALSLSLTANSLPPLLPVVCALLWFWLYRRGCRLVNPHLD